MKHFFVIFLLILGACAPIQEMEIVELPTQVIVEKTVFQCCDGSTASSENACPETCLKEEEPEKKKGRAEQHFEVTRPAKVILDQPSDPTPVAEKLLRESRNKFQAVAYRGTGKTVIVFGSRARHLFDRVKLIGDLPITDVYVDLHEETATGYCDVEREVRILKGAFDLSHSNCIDYVNKPIPLLFETWRPAGPSQVLEDFMSRTPIFVEETDITVSGYGKSRTTNPSLHYEVNNQRVILRIDKRYRVPVLIEIDGQPFPEFEDVFFDVMMFEDQPTRITEEWVTYSPVSDYWVGK